MIRLTLALAIGMSFVSTAGASLAPRREPPKFGKPFLPPAASKVLVGPRQPATDQETMPEFVISTQTEVLLDGKACKFTLVPAHARIVHLELAADNRTVVKIHFRTGK
jgi:hypothetical protein